MEIGVVKKEIEFIVVNCVIPSIILGIRGMKSLGISLDIPHGCAKLHGIEIPFLGKINNSSLTDAKNED